MDAPNKSRYLSSNKKLQSLQNMIDDEMKEVSKVINRDIYA